MANVYDQGDTVRTIKPRKNAVLAEDGDASERRRGARRGSRHRRPPRIVVSVGDNDGMDVGRDARRRSDDSRRGSCDLQNDDGADKRRLRVPARRGSNQSAELSDGGDQLTHMDARRDSMRQTMALMGDPRPHPRGRKLRSKRGSIAATETSEEEGENMDDVIEEDILREAAGFPTNRKVSLKTDPDSPGGALTTGRQMKLDQKRRQARLGAKFKRLAHFLTILFKLWRMHAKRVQHFMETNVDLLDVDQQIDLLFDVSEYKADKQARVSQETKRILKKAPPERTPEEVRYVQIALGNYDSIAEYPQHMTLIIARRAWYERYDQRRVIVRQGHPSRCYYFILAGSVIVTKMDSSSSISRTMCFLGRGESFGELGLVTNAPRQATVISREIVELLVFTDEDYVEIFMSGGLKSSDDPFLKTLPYLEGWPVEKLAEDDTNHAFLSYYKRGTVLVRDSKASDWLYIVKKGSCNVLKKLKKVKPSLFHKDFDIPREPPTEEDHIRNIQSHLATADETYKKYSETYRRRHLYDLEIGVELLPLVDKTLGPIAEVGNAKAAGFGASTEEGQSLSPFLTKTKMPNHPPTSAAGENEVDRRSKVTLYDSPKRKERQKSRRERKSPWREERKEMAERDRLNKSTEASVVFVKIQTLTKGNVFGISDILHEDQPSLSLVSNGVECVVINKRFFLDNMRQHHMRKLRSEICPYPEDEELQDSLQTYVNWVENKNRTLSDFFKYAKEGTPKDSYLRRQRKKDLRTQVGLDNAKQQTLV